MAFGVTPQGFNRARLDDVKGEIEVTLRALLGKNINLLPEGVLGQIVGLVADRESDIWEILEAVYDSYYPDTSEDVSLDRVGDISGIKRLGATKSFIDNLDVLLFGTPGTIITLGSQMSVDGTPTSVFETLSSVTLLAGLDEVQTLTLSATPGSGTFKINILSVAGTITVIGSFDDTATILQTKINTALTTAGLDVDTITVAGDVNSGGPLILTFSGDDENGFGKRDVALVTITENGLDDGGPVTVIPSETTKGVVQGSVNVQAVDTGPTIANTGTLSVIDTPISGWDTLVNIADATVGRDVETNTDFRVRREQQIARAGAATPPAVFADVSNVDDVTAVIVFFNNLAIVDLDGRPPHSVDIVVQDGDEDEITQAIFDTVGGGITFVGDITKVFTDDQGFSQTIKFSCCNNHIVIIRRTSRLTHSNHEISNSRDSIYPTFQTRS